MLIVLTIFLAYHQADCILPFFTMQSHRKEHFGGYFWSEAPKIPPNLLFNWKKIANLRLRFAYHICNHK